MHSKHAGQSTRHPPTQSSEQYRDDRRTDGRTDGACQPSSATEDELSKNTAFSALYIARAAWPSPLVTESNHDLI